MELLVINHVCTTAWELHDLTLTSYVVHLQLLEKNYNHTIITIRQVTLVNNTFCLPTTGQPLLLNHSLSRI